MTVDFQQGTVYESFIDAHWRASVLYEREQAYGDPRDYRAVSYGRDKWQIMILDEENGYVGYWKEPER